jgi:DNA-damage-inducible protein D
LVNSFLQSWKKCQKFDIKGLRSSKPNNVYILGDNHMSKNLIATTHHQTFESLKQEESGIEFWSARKLAKILEYSEYRHFLPVIQKAKEACKNSGHSIVDHFEDILDMIDIGKGGHRELQDVKLSRYACYLIVQNGDPAKPVIANGQTYFAIQTRRQEIADNQIFQQLKEDEKRVYLRKDLREHNKQLVQTAQEAGVETTLDFAIFQNHGYKGLYGGLDAKDIHERKGLKKSQKILDHMGSIELAANLFRATQAEDKLRRENIQGKAKANQTHYEVGTVVRQTIEKLGGTMPEDLPVAEKSIRKLEKELQPNLIE